jgi:hypothetical protein
MINYREHSSAIERLKAYYKNTTTFNDIPFQEAQKLEITNLPFTLKQNEYVINILRLENKNSLFVTSRRLIVQSEKGNVRSFDIESISAVYLEFPYKKEQPPHFLSVLVDDHKVIKLQFRSLEDLVSARNEIHKVISILLIDWKGVEFNVAKLESLPNIEIEII